MKNARWKRTFATIYAGQAFSILGSAAVQFAIIWNLTAWTESAMTLTLATMVSFLPNMVLGPFAGVWIDRYNRRTVMMAADGLVAISSGALGAAFLLWGTPPVWFVYLILFVRGLGNTFHTPAMQAAIPMFVPADMLTKAGGWGNLIVSLSTMAGPALGAWLMAAFPIAAVMLVDIAGAAFAILCLLMIALPDVPRRSEAVHMWPDLRQGFQAMRENKALAAVFWPVVLTSILYLPLSSLFPLLVRVHYRGGAWHNAVVQLVFSAGLLLSSLVLGLWGSSKGRFRMVSAAIGAMGLLVCLSGLLPAEAFAVFVMCSFLMGGSGTFFDVPLMAHIQETVPPEMMGKVFSLLTTAMTLATPFGLLAAGPVSEMLGVQTWFAGSGLLMVILGAFCFLTTRKYDRPAEENRRASNE